MIPIIGVVGRHNVGKTTFVTGLIRALRARGLQVATIKHTSEQVAIDHEGTDTWRFAEAGSQFVAIAGPHGSAILLPQGQEPAFWELAAQVPTDTSIIIVEGYKRLSLPKIEVMLEGKPGTAPEELVAVIQREPDSVLSEIPQGVPIYQANDWDQVIELLIAKGLVSVSTVSAT
ncbi:MAG: molybdopterin-guanine dinucleotide biosynthesis protein B [Anaerolineae bacterium]